MTACSPAAIAMPISPLVTANVVANPIAVLPNLLPVAAHMYPQPLPPVVEQATVEAAPFSHAGIIIHFPNEDTYLMGQNGSFNPNSNQYNPAFAPGRTVGEFIDTMPLVNINDMINYCKARLAANPIIGIADYDALCRTQLMRINPVFDFVKNYILSPFVISQNIPGAHVVNNHTSVRLYQLLGKWSFPKGGFNRHVDGLTPDGQLNLLETALREFNEEIGCNLRAIPGLNLNGFPPVVGKNVNINTLYDIGNVNGYKTYYMCVGLLIRNQIMANVPAHQNNSELFNISFTHLPADEEIGRDSYNMKNLIPAGFRCRYIYNQPAPAPVAASVPAAGGGGGKFQGGPQTRGNGAGINSDRWRGGSIYLHKLQKYQNKLNKN